MVENITEKEEIACYKQFLPFPLFYSIKYLRVVKSRDCVGKV